VIEFLDRREATPAHLAVDDLRSLPNVHNSHLTILVRVGVLGISQWFLTWLVWCRTLAISVLRSPRGVRDPTVALTAWLLAAELGHLVNAYFDPSLEGPQACVRLYVVFGMGIVSTRRQPEQVGSSSSRGLAACSVAGADLGSPW
jgi:hypothetical protein